MSLTATLAKPVIGSFMGSRKMLGITLTMIFRVAFSTAVQVVKTRKSEAWMARISRSGAAKVPAGITGMTPGKTGLTKCDPVSLK